MKKILALALIVGVGLFVARKTHFASYVNTCVSEVNDEMQRSIPTKFELQRIRNEIARLDQDVARRIRPVAEWKTEIDWLRKDVERSQANLDEKRTRLLAQTEEVKNRPVSIRNEGQRLQKDFDSFKRLETHVKTQRKVLEAKEAALKGQQEQLAKVLEKKREYEMRVEQLEAENATLEVARIGNKLQLDNSLATQIETALTAVEKQIDTERNYIDMRSGNLTREETPARQQQLDVNAIRDYLRQQTQDEPAKTE